MAVLENGIMIPQRCIKELQGRFSVFIINEENKVEMREVKVGPQISNFWVIKEGLMTGEKVVYEGIQKVKEGGMVNPIIQDIKPTDQ
jgi:membrane fusion protein (multidrug efflux system)